MTVTKDMRIGEILAQNMDTAKFFLEMGMHCLGCPASQNETLAEACDVHGVDSDSMVKNINEFLANL